jgi:hypothetical protein
MHLLVKIERRREVFSLSSSLKKIKGPKIYKINILKRALKGL